MSMSARDIWLSGLTVLLLAALLGGCQEMNGNSPENQSSDRAESGEPEREALTARDEAFHRAMNDRDEEVALHLLEEGASPFRPDDRGVTPLHMAARAGLLEVAVELVIAGAELEARVQPGLTPLHWAVRSQSLGIVQFLVESGADINAETDSGATPLDLAIVIGNEELLDYLVENGGVANRNELP